MIRDIDKVHAGIGDKLVILIQWVTTFFAGFLIGFIKDWRLALVLLAIIPIILTAGLIATWVRPLCMCVCVHVCVCVVCVCVMCGVCVMCMCGVCGVCVCDGIIAYPQ